MLVLVDSNEDTDRAKKKNEEARKKGRDDLVVTHSNKRVMERLRQRFPDVQAAPLTCGDINIILDEGGTLAIERKRAGDFLGSIREGHLKRQVQRMNENADWSIVIVEGLITFDKDDMAVIPLFDKNDDIYAYETTGWHGEAVRSTTYALMFNGTPVVAIKYPQQLPDIIETFVKFCSKPAEHMQGLPRRRLVTFPPMTVQEDIFMQFPGVGGKRTRSLVQFAYDQNGDLGGTEHMNTPVLAEMLCWGSYLIKIEPRSRPEGWGDTTCLNFRAALGLQEGQYLNIEIDKEEVKAKKERLEKQRLNERKNENVKNKR
jgi:ERCC4-type nuclease